MSQNPQAEYSEEKTHEQGQFQLSQLDFQPGIHRPAKAVKPPWNVKNTLLLSDNRKPDNVLGSINLCPILLL